jgi:adenylate cyclase
MTIHPYLPQDRLRALANNTPLSDRTLGSALFADISGFTPLTESLQDVYGARRGSEELTRHLETVYSALIAAIETFGGSVISFAGDAILCWFDEMHGSAAPRAVASAFGLQAAIRSFESIQVGDRAVALSLKVTVASGTARRFVAGDPEVMKFDLLAGATVARTATAEHHTQKGEILLDEASMTLLGDSLTVREWRKDDETQERFAVVTRFNALDAAPSLPTVLRMPPPTKLMPWMPYAVFESEQYGQASFLTKFRPCVALFVRFTSIDYESEAAEAELDDLVQQVQKAAGEHDGLLLQITIGDKGSYAYVNFGALSTHEDNAGRALKTALQLMNTTSLRLQVGIAQGIMRVGAYGGETRKVFGALGDAVNLAARLMTLAEEGEVLVSNFVHQAVIDQFTFEPRPPLQVKGKAEPLPVFAVTGGRRQRAIRLQEPVYTLPMVGREQELQLVNEKLDLAADGQGQVIGIVSEAGLGKSRLVAEVIRSAHRKGFVGFGGACQSDGIHTPYLVWKPIWQAFFDIDPDMPARKLVRWLEGEIEDRAPSRVEALPLLNAVLDLDIPENDFSRHLEPKYRQSALHALLEDCLKAQAKDEPVLIVMEDLHWIDALSHDLLEGLAKALVDQRVCFMLAYRPPQMERLLAPRIEALPQFTRVELHELTTTEAESAIRAKLAQLYPARGNALPPGLVDVLMQRAQGNPFYLEELLNFVRDRGLDPADLHSIELPDSLHTLILSRIDQLSEQEKDTLRVASIIGRLFPAKWLTGYYPELGALPQVKASLDTLETLDITCLDTPEPELAYLFKHIVTYEVTYESLPFSTRARLHEQLAGYLEKQITLGVLPEAALLDTLVFHYTRSENREKQRLYLQKAGQAAMEISAFHTALEYFTQLLTLTPEEDPCRSSIALQLAEAQFRVGDTAASRAAIEQAQAAARTDVDRATALAFWGEAASDMGNYEDAQTVLLQAVPLARLSRDRLTLCRALYALGNLDWRLGKLEEANLALEESLVLVRELGDVTRELFALNRLGTIAMISNDQAGAERLFMEVHARAVAAGNREREMVALNNLGALASRQMELARGRDYLQQMLVLAGEIGAQDMQALGLIGLGDIDISLSNLPAARAELREGLALCIRLQYTAWLVATVMYFGRLAYAEGQPERAFALLGLAHSQPAWHSEIQDELEISLAKWAQDPAVVEAGMAKGAELDWDTTIQELLKG